LGILYSLSYFERTKRSELVFHALLGSDGKGKVRFERVIAG